LGIPQNAKGALQKALHFLPSLDQDDADLAKFIAAWSHVPEAERQIFLDRLAGLQMPQEAPCPPYGGSGRPERAQRLHGIS
jgi:hypothetical protein